MPKPALPWIVAFVVGLAFGYISWGDHARRTEVHFVDELGAVLSDVKEQNRLMQDILAEGERKTYASLAVCEKAQVKLQAKLETCLFGKADEHPIDEDSEHLDTDSPRAGLAPIVETYSYPAGVPGTPPPPDPDAPKAPTPKVLQPDAE